MKTNLKAGHELVGIHRDMPSEQYHRAPGISFTGYKDFLQSPKHYRFRKDNPKPTTPSQLLGQLTHCMSLEPEQTEKRFMRIGERATPKLKEQAAAEGKTAVNDTTWEKAEVMAKAVLAHPEAGHLIRTGVKEVSGFAIHEQHGILWKCRPDIWHEETNSIIDLKYVDDASEDGFLRQVLRMKYQFQSAWYLDCFGSLVGKPLQRHIHICVEDDGPNEVKLHCLSDQDIQAARTAINAKLEHYAECEAKGEWPGYAPGIIPMVLPHYAYKLTDEGEVMG